jgi:hypothetical protein
MASRRPAVAHAYVGGVVHVADIHLAGRNTLAGQLSVAPEAQVRIRLGEQLRVNRTVRAVTNRATFAQRRVLEYEWSRLFAVTLRTILVHTSHRESTGWFHDVHPMRIVALNTIHLFLQHRVMLGQMKLHFR